MAKVLGIGGIFFKTKNPSETKDWYQKHLGINTDEYGSTFEWRQADKEEKGFTQWSPMKSDTDYFEPSTKEFMINYRVDNIEEMVKELAADGIKTIDDIEEYEYGKFVHLLDNDGNKIELWEPNDDKYEKIAEAITK